MTFQPKISTITPSYKGERYLKRFLDELPKQTIFKDIQVVLDLNEPSNDERKWAEDFKSRYPDQLKLNIVEEVDPIGVSMNRCIKLSEAPCLAIWNVDDLRTPDSLEKQYRAFESGYDVVHGNFVIVNQFGGVHGKLVDHSWTVHQPEALRKGMHLGPFFGFKKDLVEEAGLFDEGMVSGCDYDLALRLTMNGTVGIVHGVLGYYLDEQKGQSTGPNSKQAVERTLIEMRYGLKVLEPHLMSEVEKLAYDVNNLQFGGEKFDVKHFMGENK